MHLIYGLLCLDSCSFTLTESKSHQLPAKSSGSAWFCLDLLSAWHEFGFCSQPQIINCGGKTDQSERHSTSTIDINKLFGSYSWKRPVYLNSTDTVFLLPVAGQIPLLCSILHLQIFLGYRFFSLLEVQENYRTWFTDSQMKEERWRGSKGERSQVCHRYVSAIIHLSILFSTIKGHISQ